MFLIIPESFYDNDEFRFDVADLLSDFSSAVDKAMWNFTGYHRGVVYTVQQSSSGWGLCEGPVMELGVDFLTIPECFYDHHEFITEVADLLSDFSSAVDPAMWNFTGYHTGVVYAVEEAGLGWELIEAAIMELDEDYGDDEDS